MTPRQETIAAASLAALLAAACGPNAGDVKQAREVAYQIDYTTVWNAVSAEMHQRFEGGVKKEDAASGVIESEWKRIELEKESDPGKNVGGGATNTAQYFRMRCRVVGGPPWRVVVEGEAAQYKPNFSSLIPYKHGDIDEPTWVPGRIDAMHLAVYERLKQYAVKAPADARGAGPGTAGPSPGTPPPPTTPSPEPSPAPAPLPAPSPAQP